MHEITFNIRMTGNIIGVQLLTFGNSETEASSAIESEDLDDRGPFAFQQAC